MKIVKFEIWCELAESIERLPFRAREATRYASQLLDALRSQEVPTRRGRNAHVTKVLFFDGVAAVKIYPNDGRRRLEHEWQVLLALAGSGRRVAPQPILRCSSPAQNTEWAVYEWLPGRALTSSGAPEGKILEYLSELHSVSPPVGMPSSLLNQTTIIRGRYGINAQLRLLELARAANLPRLRNAYSRLLALTPGIASAAQVVCHTDSNPSNFISSGGVCKAVDWDAGGLGDPVFELAELSMHPAIGYADAEAWLDRITASYARPLSSADISLFKYFRLTMALWWACRLARQELESHDTFLPKDARRMELCMSIADNSIC